MTEPRSSTFDDGKHRGNLLYADWLQNQGNHAQRAQAADLLRQNLSMSSKHFSDIDPTVLSDRDSLSDCLQELGDYKGAVKLDEVTLPIRQRIDNEAEDTVATLQSLADNLSRLGQHGKAIPLYRTALSTRERTCGLTHEATLSTKHNLASSLYEFGQAREASIINRQILKVREEQLATDDYDLVATTHNLAADCYALGDLGRAVQLTNRNLRVLQDTRPSTDTQLLEVIALQGRIKETIQEAKRPRAMRMRNDAPVPALQEPTNTSARPAPKGLEATMLHVDSGAQAHNSGSGHNSQGEKKVIIPPMAAAPIWTNPNKRETKVPNAEVKTGANAQPSTHPPPLEIPRGPPCRRRLARSQSPAAAGAKENNFEDNSLKLGTDIKTGDYKRQALSSMPEARAQPGIVGVDSCLKRNDREVAAVNAGPHCGSRYDGKDALVLPKTVEGNAAPQAQQRPSSSNRRGASDRTRDAQQLSDGRGPFNTDVSGDPRLKVDRPRAPHNVSETLKGNMMNETPQASLGSLTDIKAGPRSSEEQMASRSKLATLTTPTAQKPRSRSAGAVSKQQHDKYRELRAFSKLCDARDGEFYDNKSFETKPRWLDRFRETQSLVAQGRKPNNSRVKIAILDTGVDLGHPYFHDTPKDHPQIHPKDRVRECKSFVHGASGDHDNVGHGTHCTALLLELAPNADVYVARVSEGGASNLDPEVVARAITHAAAEWKVAIISMSFGWPERHSAVANAIEYATSRSILLCAAASNGGANDGVAFPAHFSPVFCVHSTNEKGKPSDFTPNVLQFVPNFAILGENVQAAWPGQKEGRSQTGTSVATPILAAVMALVVEYVHQKPRKTSDRKMIIDYRVMQKILVAMSPNVVEGYHYVRPWELMSSKWDRGQNDSNIQHAIR